MTSAIHYHDRAEPQVKERLTKFGGFSLHLWCSMCCIISEEDLITWQSRPLWGLSRNFLWLSLLSSFSSCLLPVLSSVFPLLLFTFKHAVIHLSCPSSAVHPSRLTQFPWRWVGGWGCCNCPVYAIPLVLKWQAGDRYAILKRGLMNFWHLISCFPVNISWLAGAWSAPPGPLWSAG